MRPYVTSAWHGHLTFAHWLVEVVNPAVIVELGTHNGLSYSAFCKAISQFSPGAKCYAIDTWEGDVHAGAYSNAVYEDLSQFTEENFATIGIMIRSYFDDALDKFKDGSVDILHIDGLHTYEAVRHDFETWKPKLSDRAVVLFHDTEVRGGDFGVWKFWEELSQQYPNFNFLHSAGLGVLAVGKVQPKSVLEFCSLSSHETKTVRELFERASHASRIFGQHLLSTDSGGLIPSSGTNFARNRPVMQSSRLEEGSPRQSPTDGIKDGTYGFHTTQENQPWVIIDLQQIRNVSRIAIFNRLSDACAERARNICASISIDGMDWAEIYKHNGRVFGGIDGKPLLISVGREARFVRIWLADANFLHLDQIEVY